MRTILIACLLGAGLTGAAAGPARLEKGAVPAGPSRAAVERWFTAGRELTCFDRNLDEGPCDLSRAITFSTFYDANEANALVFVIYSASVSNAVSHKVGQFRRSDDGWVLVRNIRGVWGEGPDSLSFEGGRAVFTMAALMPGDARCCLSGTQRYELDLATGAVKEGPKLPGLVKAQPASSKRFAPRPEGYQGASYFHNGSEVLVDERAGVIRYEVPKASIRKAVAKGTVLFRGAFATDGSVSGMAYVFKADCEPAPYPVMGWSKGSTIELRGLAPHRDPNSCAIVASSKRSAHSTLRFEEFSDF
ncbi:hypothetical protein ASF34_21715 [Methylobacterium sp. Leaf106]|nr:hypothetical protein ASF34_21715 [Methylobacterium sp. Leaf106]